MDYITWTMLILAVIKWCFDLQSNVVKSASPAVDAEEPHAARVHPARAGLQRVDHLHGAELGRPRSSGEIISITL